MREKDAEVKKDLVPSLKKVHRDQAQNRTEFYRYGLYHLVSYCAGLLKSRLARKDISKVKAEAGKLDMTKWVDVALFLLGRNGTIRFCTVDCQQRVVIEKD